MRRILLPILIYCGVLLAQPYDGTAVGSPTYSTGKFGSALTGFSSINYATLPVGATAIGSRTIEAWINRPSALGHLWSVSPGHIVYLNTSTILFNTVGSEAYTTGQGTVSTWVHVATVCMAGQIARIYLDGVLGTNSATTASCSTLSSALSIGYDPSGASSGTALSGLLIDELVVWPGERYTSNFTPPTAAYTGGEGMRALYHLNGNLTDTAGGVSGGTLTSSNCVGLCLTGAASGTYQLQKATYSGTCGSFSNLGSSVSGSGSASFADASGTASCYRVSVNAGAAFSTTAIAPGGSGTVSY